MANTLGERETRLILRLKSPPEANPRSTRLSNKKSTRTRPQCKMLIYAHQCLTLQMTNNLQNTQYTEQLVCALVKADVNIVCIAM